MLVTPFLVFSTLLLGYGVGRRFLGAESNWEALSVAPLLACLVIASGAATWGPLEGRWPTAVLAGLFMLLLAALPAPAGRPTAATDQGPAKFGLRYSFHGLAAVMVVGSAVYFQLFAFDPQGWIQGPLIASFTLGLFPASDPFLSNSKLTGGHGAELVAGALLPQGQDPASVFWFLVPILALCCYGVFWALFGTRGESLEKFGVVVLATFFGFWSFAEEPLAGSLAGSNGFFYAIALLLFYSLLRLLELLPTRYPGHPLGLWGATGYLLGVTALLDPSDFRLWLLTLWVLLPLALWRSQQRGRLLGGAILASAIAVVVASGTLGALPLFGLAESVLGNRLGAHGWPRLGAEVVIGAASFVWLARRQYWPGVALGLFAGLALIAPWGNQRTLVLSKLCFFVLAGLAVADLIAQFRCPGRFRVATTMLGWVLLTVLVWPGLQKLSWAVDSIPQRALPKLLPAGEWRAERPEFGVTRADLVCARTLGQQILPGETLLTNLGPSSELGLWPDSAVASLSGARIAGHAAPSTAGLSDAPSRYRRSALQLALLESGRVDLLWNSGVDWLLLDSNSTVVLEALARSAHALRVRREEMSGGQASELWRLDPPASLALERLSSQPPFRSQVLFLGPDGPRSLQRLEPSGWQRLQPYRLQIAAFNAQQSPARLGWLRILVRNSENNPVDEPLYYLLGANPLPSSTGDLHEVLFVTPSETGAFTVTGELLLEGNGTEPLFSFPIEVD